ncbi:heme/hemin ABC transporter substrate-binding protein [Aquiflexum gelatinilyticum]|uniref:ABC transporter substrate-binding protein n=1 Tax=Aquiflexum gelatinilyticum TaxID=2961943 RepID=A0A9X2PAI0_9BACT|nr:ABC transporter substrate-binding protein [Aquiflexum gelatinilyticum]MCR9015100.1 ABC transporter substrate-binding protein [Aquiflexum gelatinilyticum]
MTRKISLFLFGIILFGCSEKRPEAVTKEYKIITAGGTVTEVVNELGFGDDIIATDITSTYPAKMQALPSIGYRNQIKAEGILALGPDLILAEEGYMSPDVVNQLIAAGLQIRFFEKPKDISGTYKIVTEIADFLEVPEKGNEIKASIEADMKELGNYLQSQTSKPSMAFVMARGMEMVFVAGEETFAESMGNMAGINYVGKGFNEFIPLTPEALVAMNPDFLLFFESGIQSIGGMDGVKNIRGIENTSAFRKNQIISMDGQYLSGFGPRVGKAALELAKAVRK